MKQRLNENQIEEVNNKYKDHTFYKIIFTTCKPIECELMDVMPCPEEFFIDIIRILDDMKSNPMVFIKDRIPQLWDSIYAETSRADKTNDKIQMQHYSTIVLGIIIFIMHWCDKDIYYATMKNALSRHLIEKDSNNFNELLKDVSVRIDEFKKELQEWINEYMDSDIFMSNEILSPLATFELPKDIDSQRTRTYFAKAIEAKYMTYENGKFRWIGTGNKQNNSQLAYFCGVLFYYNHSAYGNKGQEFPGETLEKSFGVKRLYSSLTQVHNAKKKQRWRSQIDALFE